MWWREESENFSVSLYVKFHLKFRKNNTHAFVISKRLKFPKDDQTDANFTRRLECISRYLKSTLDSLKRKPSLGAPINNLFPSLNGKTSQQNEKTCTKFD